MKALVKITLALLLVLFVYDLSAQKAPQDARVFRPGAASQYVTTLSDGSVGRKYPAVQDFIPSRNEAYQIGDFVKYNGEIYECLLQTTAAPDSPVVTPPGAAWEKKFGFDIARVADYDKLGTFTGEQDAVFVTDETTGGLFKKDATATVADGGVVPVIGWRRVSTPNEYNPIWYGAKASSSELDTAQNTSIIQGILDATPAGRIIRVPSGLWYDWTKLNIPDFTMIYDDSGFDIASGSLGLPQSYTRTIARTNDQTNLTNGNTQWITADYHPAYGVQNIAEPGTANARASTIMWQKSGNSLFSYGTQLVQELTDLASARFSILSYNNTGSGQVNSKAVLSFTHSYDRDRVGAMGFNIQEPSDASYEYGVAGVPPNADASDPTWLAKNMVTYKSLPQDGTGRFDMLWRPGVQDFWHRRIVRSNQVEHIYPGADGMRQFFANGTIFTENDATQYGSKEKITNMANSTSDIGVLYNNSTYTNANNTTGGVAKTLPEAIEGRVIRFIVVQPQNLRLVPEAGDKFVDRPVGEYMQSRTPGSSIEILCHEDGVWSFKRTGVWENESSGLSEVVDAIPNHILNQSYSQFETVRATDGQVYFANTTTVTAPGSADWTLSGTQNIDVLGSRIRLSGGGEVQVTGQNGITVSSTVSDEIVLDASAIPWRDGGASGTAVLTSTGNTFARIEQPDGDPLVLMGDLGTGDDGSLFLYDNGTLKTRLRAGLGSYFGNSLSINKTTEPATGVALDVEGVIALNNNNVTGLSGSSQAGEAVEHQQFLDSLNKFRPIVVKLNNDSTRTSNAVQAFDLLSINGIPAGTYTVEVDLRYQSDNAAGGISYSWNTTNIDAALSGYVRNNAADNQADGWTATVTDGIRDADKLHIVRIVGDLEVDAVAGDFVFKFGTNGTGNVTLLKGSTITLKPKNSFQ